MEISTFLLYKVLADQRSILNLAVKIAKSSDFQSQFSMSKIIRIIPKKFSLKNMKLGARLLLLTHLFNVIFETLYLLKLGQNFKP